MKTGLLYTLLSASLVLLTACDSQQKLAPIVAPVVADEVGEIKPGSGILRGYLDLKDLPNSLTLLPSPPGPGSAAVAVDEAIYAQMRALANTPRWEIAVRDADLHFPKAAETFVCALGLEVSADRTPHLNMLLRRTLADAGFSTYRAKDHYNRTRPFVENKSASCTPSEESRLVKDGSYPSGHAAVGWAWALVLTEIVPDRADALLARGHAYGQSRVVCGVHWQSDVDAARMMGAAAVARLHADPVFRAQMKAAADEVKLVRGTGAQPSRNCAAEAAALK